MSMHESVLAQIRSVAAFLDTFVVEDRIAELRRGGLPSTSMPGGSHSAETPGPELDSFDQLIDRHETLWRSALNRMLTAGRQAERVQRSLASVMGQYEVNDPDPEVARRAMDKARLRATEELTAEEEQGTLRFQCEVCAFIFKRTATQRPVAGRSGRGGETVLKCRACYEYGQAHPEAPIPPEVVVARRVEREMHG